MTTCEMSNLLFSLCCWCVYSLVYLTYKISSIYPVVRTCGYVYWLRVAMVAFMNNVQPFLICHVYRARTRGGSSTAARVQEQSSVILSFGRMKLASVRVVATAETGLACPAVEKQRGETVGCAGGIKSLARSGRCEKRWEALA